LGAIEEDIRIQIIVMSVIYVLAFFFLLRLKFLPDEYRRIGREINQFRQKYEQKSDDEGSKPKEEVVITVEGLRTYFYTEEFNIKEGKCPYCGVAIDGIW